MYTTIYRSAVGNALVAIIGTVPGYWFTVAFVDKWGRIPIQYMGFAMMTTLLVILAAAYPQVRERGAPCLLLLLVEREKRVRERLVIATMLTLPKKHENKLS